MSPRLVHTKQLSSPALSVCSGAARYRAGLSIFAALAGSVATYGCVALAPGVEAGARASTMGALGAACGVVMYAAPLAQVDKGQ